MADSRTGGGVPRTGAIVARSPSRKVVEWTAAVSAAGAASSRRPPVSGETPLTQPARRRRSMTLRLEDSATRRLDDSLRGNDDIEFPTRALVALQNGASTPRGVLKWLRSAHASDHLRASSRSSKRAHSGNGAARCAKPRSVCGRSSRRSAQRRRRSRPRGTR